MQTAARQQGSLGLPLPSCPRLAEAKSSYPSQAGLVFISGEPKAVKMKPSSRE